MRRKIRCDCAAEPPGELIDDATAWAPRHREGALEHGRDAGDGEPGAKRHRGPDRAR